MNKGINMAQGRYAIFLNSGDVFHDDVAQFARQLARQKDDAMYIGQYTSRRLSGAPADGQTGPHRHGTHRPS